MFVKKICCLLIILLSSLGSFSNTPSVRIEDKIRIREANNIRDVIGESIWSGISKSPFALILVTKDYEYLFYHPNPSTDFVLLEKDTITGSDIYYRRTQYPIFFEATFPAVNGISCIVIGTPENTQSNHSSKWVLTVLHESFHQYQSYQPYHYKQVNALDLSGGDTSGMWQLNYPFPYTEQKVETLYNEYKEALLKAFENKDTPQFEKQYSLFLQKRTDLKKSLSEQDYKYFSFQIWKEGIARYTEYKYLQALQTYKVSDAFKKLEDYKPYKIFINEFMDDQLAKLKSWRISDKQRVVFYAIGLVEGILLDKAVPDWHINYFLEKFQIENIF